jgi:hypothetical protein
LEDLDSEVDVIVLEKPLERIKKFWPKSKQGRNLVKAVNGDVLADLHSALNRWKNFKKAYDSVRKEVLYIILIEFGVPRLMCLYG